MFKAMKASTVEGLLGKRLRRPFMAKDWDTLLHLCLQIHSRKRAHIWRSNGMSQTGSWDIYIKHKAVWIATRPKTSEWFMLQPLTMYHYLTIISFSCCSCNPNVLRWWSLVMWTDHGSSRNHGRHWGQTTENGNEESWGNLKVEREREREW